MIIKHFGQNIKVYNNLFKLTPRRVGERSEQGPEFPSNNNKLKTVLNIYMKKDIYSTVKINFIRPSKILIKTCVEIF